MPTTSEMTESKQRLSQELVGARFGDYVITSDKKWRKRSGRQARTYVEVSCSHGSDLVLLDNLKRGEQQGCRRCYLERNTLPVLESQEERDLYYRCHSVILRCTNIGTRGYGRYGGRGVFVQKEWVDNPLLMVRYLQYLPGYSLEKQIDRANNDLGYVEGNLRWATKEEQARNKSNSQYVEYKGERIFVQDFARDYTDLSDTMVRRRLAQGWTPEEIVAWKPLPRGNRVRFGRCRT